MNASEKRMLLPILRKLANHEKLNHRAQSAAEQLYARLTRPAPKKVQGRLRRNSEKQSARASHNQETARVYVACSRRANRECECGCGIWFARNSELAAEMDHFYGRRVAQSAENCWLLIAAHHKRKTENQPSREHWDRLFAAHCAKYGYEFKPRLIHAEPAKAGGAP